jgi:hypothetical protein
MSKRIREPSSSIDRLHKRERYSPCKYSDRFLYISF